MPTLLYFLTGIICAAIAAWLLYRNVCTSHNTILESLQHQKQSELCQFQKERQVLIDEKDTLLTRASRAESQVEFLSKQYESFLQLQESNVALQKQLATLSAIHQASELKLENQKDELNNIGEKFRFEFRNLAQLIFEEKSEKFSQVNEEKMRAILDPLKSEIGLFKLKVEETYDKESKERFSLGREVERLIIMTQQVSQEANNLTTALKGNNKMQGDWGEMILESLLESSGLTKDREYFLQAFIRDNAGNIIKDDEGKGLQPDVMICYPDMRKVIIDSKVSLLAWDECVSQDNKTEQNYHLQQHIKSVRSHIDGLSRKNYPRYALAIDYVLLFIPIEPAFLEALKEDKLLWKYAYDRKILLVSPTNLFAVLRIIADLWKVEQQNRNAQDIAEKAGSMYDKFVSFIENLELVGKKITEANISYEAAFKQLSKGKGNIINKVEELKKLGAKATKQIPDKTLLALED